MYQVAYGRLAAAVSNAGGLGVIGSAYMEPERLREEIRLAKSETDKPFGVDILFAKTSGGGATIAAYEREVRAHIDVTFKEGCAVIVSGLGDPGAIVAQAHAAGIKVMALVGTAKQAQGRRAVGRRRDRSPRGTTAAAMSGASARWCSCRAWSIRSRFRWSRRAASPTGAGLSRRWRSARPACGWARASSPPLEARGHDNYKRRITEIDEDGTVVTRAHSGKPNRMIRNEFTQLLGGPRGRDQALSAPVEGGGRAGILSRPHRGRYHPWRARLRPERGPDRRGSSTPAMSCAGSRSRRRVSWQSCHARERGGRAPCHRRPAPFPCRRRCPMIPMPRGPAVGPTLQKLVCSRRFRSVD